MMAGNAWAGCCLNITVVGLPWDFLKKSAIFSCHALHHMLLLLQIGKPEAKLWQLDVKVP